MAAAAADAAPPARSGPSLVVQVGVLLALTIAAAGMGWVSGDYLDAPAAASDPAAAAASGAHSPAGGHGAASGHGEAGGHGAAAEAHGEATGDASPEHPMIIPLAPITTNLAAPSQVWVRMELSIQLEAAPEADLADAVHQDILAYVRSLKMHQVEGASGFQHLKADLEELAAIRSDGKVKHVLIRTLLFE